MTLVVTSSLGVCMASPAPATENMVVLELKGEILSQCDFEPLRLRETSLLSALET